MRILRTFMHEKRNEFKGCSSDMVQQHLSVAGKPSKSETLFAAHIRESNSWCLLVQASTPTINPPPPPVTLL